MGTQLQYIQDFTNYIKCGEILKSPLQNYQDSIILKCIQCKEVHFRLEKFVKHLQEHFKDVLSPDDESKAEYENIHVDEMESEGVGVDNMAIKIEEELSIMTEDSNIYLPNMYQNTTNTLQTSEGPNEMHAQPVTFEAIEPMFIRLTNEVTSLRQEIDGLRYEVKDLKKENSTVKLVLPESPYKLMDDFLNFEKQLQENKEFLDSFDDPLFPVKCEIDEVKAKDDNKPQDLETRNKNYNTENVDEFEDILDSPDEFNPDDDESNSDSDYVIKELNNKKKRKNPDDVKADDSETDEDDGPIKESLVRRNIKIPPHVDSFMQSKPNVLTIIDLYKNQPSLWDKYSPYYRLKDKKKQCFEEITQELNKKCSINLTWNETAEIISYIYTKHRDDFKRIHYRNPKKKKEKKTQGKYERKAEKKLKSCWFYDNLHFLRSKVTLRLQCLDSNLPELTPEQIKRVLEIYKSVPHLWNTFLIEHICSNKRQDALDEMLKTLETTMNLKIDSNTLEQYIHTIHEYFSREKRKIFGISTPEDIQNTSKRELNYYDYMMFLEDHEGPFQCPNCNGIYAKPLCFRIHKSTHDGSTALKCSQCDQEFKTVSSFTTHAKRHLEDLQFVCKICNLKLLRHSDLKIHLLTHTDARPYCCEICGASYRQSNSFRKHQRQHEKRFSHTCHICSKGYYTKYRYVDHMNSHMNIRQHICNICGKGFITSRALKTHAVTHEDARNHACKLCGKTFKLKIGVLQHMRTHGSKVETEKSSLIL